MGKVANAARSLAPRLTKAAPGLTTGFVREALERAITGIGPLQGAAAAAEDQLADHGGDTAKAIHDLIENHVRFAAAQGFLTNLGGLATAVVLVPTNITGLAVVQCRMVAAIAHVRGYDLNDGRVRNAILACVIGEDDVKKLIKRKELPGTPMALATAPAYDPDLAHAISNQVAEDMLTQITGKRSAAVISKKVPVLGALVGMGSDAYETWRIGRYADRELLPRSPSRR